MSKRLFLLSVLCVLLCAGQSFAQVLSGVKGIVKIADAEPAVSASVELKSDKKVKSTITNQNGEFVFQKIHPGHYKLLISMVGYDNIEQELDVVKDEITRLEFKMKAVDGSLDDVTVRGGSKYVIDDVSGSLRLQTPLLEVPQNIQIISAQLIADQQVFDMVDGVTRNVSGATRSGHWDNQYANIRMRGSKAPAFRNGMNIEASWGPTAEDMSMVERIEFVKGPAGFMLAAGEPGGFYNVVTKKPTGNTRGSANFSFGSFSTYRGAFDFDGKLTKNGKLLYRLNVMAQQKDSHVKYNFNNRYLVAPVLKYIVDEKTSVTFEYTYQGSSYGTNGTYAFSPKELGDVANDFSYGDPAIAPGKLRDHSVYAYLDHKFNSKWQMNAQVAYFNFEMIGNSIWPSKVYANGNMERAYSVGDEAGENRFAQVSFRGVEHTGAIKHTLLAGVDAGNKKFWGDFRQYTANLKLGGGKIFNVYSPIYGVPFDSIPKIDRSVGVKTRAAQSTYITSNNYVSAYLQDELAFFDEKLRVSVAGRFTHAEIVAKTDAADVVSDVFTPRVGISYSINSEMSIYTLYDQSFIPVAGTDYDGNAFVPIRGNDIEFGIKKEWFHGRLRTTGTVYQIKRKNALVADDRIGANGQTFQTQLGETTSKGVEIDVNGEVLPGLNASMNYAYTDSKISAEAKGTDPAKTTIGNITPGTAAHITNAWLQYRIRSGFFQGLGASFGMQWQAERAAGATKVSNIPNYFRTDAGVSYSRDKYSITLMVNNLGDDRQLYTSVTLPSASTNYYTWIAEPRRNFRTTIAYRF